MDSLNLQWFCLILSFKLVYINYFILSAIMTYLNKVEQNEKSLYVMHVFRHRVSLYCKTFVIDLIFFSKHFW